MSRSFRKTPMIGMTAAPSEKQDKRDANRRIRRRIHSVLTHDPLTDVLPHRREISDPWTMAKDGKQWIDPAHCPKEMRK